MPRRSFLIQFVVSLFVLAVTFPAMSKDSFFEKGGLFIGGYDPVAYITQSKAVEGTSEHNLNYKGTKIQFSSEESKQKFQQNPEKYIPAYNGWCAYAMAKNGTTYRSDPKTFKVINGRTYLFYNSFLTNTLTKWNKKGDEEGQIKQGDLHWAKLSQP